MLYQVIRKSGHWPMTHREDDLEQNVAFQNDKFEIHQ